MAYREAHVNQLKAYFEEARKKRSGRGAMPYQAPQPKPANTPTNEEKNPHFIGSLPPIVVERTWFALAILVLLVVFGGVVSLLGELSTDIKFLVAGGVCFGGWVYFESRYKTFLARGEVAWLKALPFEVRGYLESLCQEPQGFESSVRVTVTMEHEPLPDWVILAIPELSPRQMKVSLSKDNPLDFSISEVKIKTNITPGIEEEFSNRALRDWMHECITQILAPIDATYRLRRISISAVGQG